MKPNSERYKKRKMRKRQKKYMMDEEEGNITLITIIMKRSNKQNIE